METIPASQLRDYRKLISPLDPELHPDVINMIGFFNPRLESPVQKLPEEMARCVDTLENLLQENFPKAHIVAYETSRDLDIHADMKYQAVFHGFEKGMSLFNGFLFAKHADASHRHPRLPAAFKFSLTLPFDTHTNSSKKIISAIWPYIDGFENSEIDTAAYQHINKDSIDNFEKGHMIVVEKALPVAVGMPALKYLGLDLPEKRVDFRAHGYID